MGGRGEKVKRSPASDPREKCALTTEARAELAGHIPPKPRAELTLAAHCWRPPQPFSALLPAFAQNDSTKKPPRNKTRSPWRAGRRWDRVTGALPAATHTSGGDSQGAASRPGASVSTFVEVFQNLPPTPVHSTLSTWTWDTREDRRAEQGRRTENGRPNRARVPQSHALKLAPASGPLLFPRSPRAAPARRAPPARSRAHSGEGVTAEKVAAQ